MKAFTRAARPGQLVAFQSQPQANKEQVMSAININHVVLTGRAHQRPRAARPAVGKQRLRPAGRGQRQTARLGGRVG